MAWKAKALWQASAFSTLPADLHELQQKPVTLHDQNLQMPQEQL